MNYSPFKSQRLNVFDHFVRLALKGLRNLGYNNNSTLNQNVFQHTARNLLGISAVNIKFCNESIP